MILVGGFSLVMRIHPARMVYHINSNVGGGLGAESASKPSKYGVPSLDLKRDKADWRSIHPLYWTNETLPPYDAELVPGRRFPQLPGLPGELMSISHPLGAVITPETPLGQELFQIVQLAEVHFALEIGADPAEGSTLCIAEGFRMSMTSLSRLDKWLLSLVPAPIPADGWFSTAKLPVSWMLFNEEGRSIVDLLSLGDNSADSVSSRTSLRLPSLLELLCGRYDVDLIVINGDKAGLAAFEAIETRCRPRRIILLLRGATKAAQMAALLESSPGRWRAARRGTDSGGWALYEDARPNPAATAVPVRAEASWSGGPLPDVDVWLAPGRRLPHLPPLNTAAAAAAPAQPRGDFGEGDTFCKDVRSTAGLDTVRLALEIGTGRGGGSTWCVARGLRDAVRDPARPDRWLFTLEWSATAWEEAARALLGLPVTCMLFRRDAGVGGPVPGGEAAVGGGGPPPLVDLLRDLCGRYDFDMVVIDDGDQARRSCSELNCSNRRILREFESYRGAG